METAAGAIKSWTAVDFFGQELCSFPNKVTHLLSGFSANPLFLGSLFVLVHSKKEAA